MAPRIVVRIEPVEVEGETRHRAVCRTPACTLGVDGTPRRVAQWPGSTAKRASPCRGASQAEESTSLAAFAEQVSVSSSGAGIVPALRPETATMPVSGLAVILGHPRQRVGVGVAGAAAAGGPGARVRILAPRGRAPTIRHHPCGRRAHAGQRASSSRCQEARTQSTLI